MGSGCVGVTRGLCSSRLCYSRDPFCGLSFLGRGGWFEFCFEFCRREEFFYLFLCDFNGSGYNAAFCCHHTVACWEKLQGVVLHVICVYCDGHCYEV